MTHFVFFSGKGGVGKTSLSSATAIMLAQRGAKTLLITTDPASNLGDVFEQDVGLVAHEVNGVPHLFIQEINPLAALQEYKDRALAPLKGLFPEEVIRAAAEKMSGPCTEEVATFDQFIACMHEPQYDWVVFDTAPTGHTLRLLELPGNWSSHIEEIAKSSGQTCIGSADSLTSSKEQYDNAIRALQDPSITTFVFVTKPARLSIDEMIRSSAELRKLDISNQIAIVNGIIPEDERMHPYSSRVWNRQKPFLAEVNAIFHGHMGEMPLYAEDIKGIAMLKKVGENVEHAIRL